MGGAGVGGVGIHGGGRFREGMFHAFWSLSMTLRAIGRLGDRAAFLKNTSREPEIPPMLVRWRKA
jgi:hypothetical protein